MNFYSSWWLINDFGKKIVFIVIIRPIRRFSEILVIAEIRDEINQKFDFQLNLQITKPTTIWPTSQT